MTTFTEQEIQHDPRNFLRRLTAGEELEVVEGEHMLAQAHPLTRASDASRRPYGLCAGQFAAPADFDQPLPADLLQDFEGR